MERDQPSPNQGKPRQATTATPQRVPSTTTRPGHAQRQVTVADKEDNLAFFEISQSREETEDNLIKALRRMGKKASKHFDSKKENIES